MADNDSAQPAGNERDSGARFGASGDLYQLRPDVSEQDIIDELGTKLDHLDAMLSHTCGTSGKEFRQLNEFAQSNYMWACHTALDECKLLFRHLTAQKATADATAV